MTVLSERLTQRSEPVPMSGQQLFAEMVHGYGITHVFFVPTILTPALAAMGQLSPGITRVTTHSEKAAAYMADGYARASRKPGLCMAQTVGAANLAAGLKDAWLARLAGHRHLRRVLAQYALSPRVSGAARRLLDVRRSHEVQRPRRARRPTARICSARPSARRPRAHQAPPIWRSQANRAATP